MKRRLFLQSLWLKGIALPSAYVLSPTLRAETLEDLIQQPTESNSQGHGCGRTEVGGEKKRYGVIARDFVDPYLELIRLLKEASEIEHSLMVQYLFAAFTIKPKYRALVGPPVPSSEGLLGIAIQEMQHLAVVNKLLVALGGAPNLERQDFPHEPDIYPFPMNLERLTRRSLARFTYVEAGRTSMPTQGPVSATDQLLCDALTAELGVDTQLNHVAALYGIILNQLQRATDAGEIELDDIDDWVAQLSYIMVEGERDHFEFFSKVFLGSHAAFTDRQTTPGKIPTNPWKLDEADPDYPSFAVASNPTAYFGHANQIRSSDARALAWLGNLHYWIVLMMLDLYYRTGRESLNAMAQVQMVGPLQSIAVALAGDGVGVPFDRLSIGYSPAPDHAGNFGFIDRLSREADMLARKMRANLPPAYPIEIHRATAALIKAELKALSD